MPYSTVLHLSKNCRDSPASLIISSSGEKTVRGEACNPATSARLAAVCCWCTLLVTPGYRGLKHKCLQIGNPYKENHAITCTCTFNKSGTSIDYIK